MNKFKRVTFALVSALAFSSGILSNPAQANQSSTYQISPAISVNLSIASPGTVAGDGANVAPWVIDFQGVSTQFDLTFASTGGHTFTGCSTSGLPAGEISVSNVNVGASKCTLTLTNTANANEYPVSVSFSGGSVTVFLKRAQKFITQGTQTVFQTAAYSGKAWTVSSGVGGADQMTFNVQANVQTTFDIYVNAVSNSQAVNLAGSNCAITGVQTQGIAVSTAASNSSFVTCRVVVDALSPGGGRDVAIATRTLNSEVSGTYGIVRLSFRTPPPNNNQVNQGNQSVLGGGSPRVTAPTYSGPEFLSFGSATLAGSKLVASGKRLDAISSVRINGSAVTYKINSASELEIDLPKDLAPGKYDVEINSIHGKLTHLQGITIKAVVPTKELAFKAEGAWWNYGSLLELTNIAKQIGSEYTSVKCIVNAADPVVAERLAKRACSYVEANRLRGKAVTYESKSTFKGDGFWVRVVANG